MGVRVCGWVGARVLAASESLKRYLLAIPFSFIQYHLPVIGNIGD